MPSPPHCHPPHLSLVASSAVPAGLWSLESAAWQQAQLLASVMETAAAAGDGHL